MKRILQCIISFCFLLSLQLFPAEEIILGFVQTGSESEWRTANTLSIKEAAKRHNIKLKFFSAEGKPSKQLELLNDLIDSKVDVIAFPPLIANGYEDFLQKAKQSNIPIIIVDRLLNIRDGSLYETFIGSDFYSEGTKAGEWLINHLNSTNKLNSTVNIVELYGTKDSAPAELRHAGFVDVIKKYENIKIIATANADFREELGKKEMETILKNHSSFDVIFSHNDNMALGAIKALKNSSMRPSKNLIVIGVDGIRRAIESIISGEIHLSVECNPLLGDELMNAVKKVIKGVKLPKRIYTQDHLFDITNAKESLPSRQY